MSKREWTVVLGIFAFFVVARLMTSRYDREAEANLCAEMNKPGMIVSLSCREKEAFPLLTTAAGWLGTLTVPLVLSVAAVTINRRNRRKSTGSYPPGSRTKIAPL